MPSKITTIRINEGGYATPKNRAILSNKFTENVSIKTISKDNIQRIEYSVLNFLVLTKYIKYIIINNIDIEIRIKSLYIVKIIL